MLLLVLLVAVSMASAFKRPGLGSGGGPGPAPGLGGSAPAPGPSGSIDCITRPGPWGPCSATCGGGLRKRSLIIVQRPSGYGAKCPVLHEESENCNSHNCPIDCEVERGSFSECSSTCGISYRTRVDFVIRDAQFGGLACPEPENLRETVQCDNIPPCPVPVHCEVAYGQFSQCSGSCGIGTKSRSAFIVRQPANGGALCPDISLLSETVACQLQPCPDIYDCLYIQGSWGECSATCGQGFRKRSIYIIAQPSNGGSPCPSDLIQQEYCNLPPCPPPVDCEVQWGQWSYCSASCDGGSQSLSGQILRQASGAGIPCPLPNQLSQTRSCGNSQCVQIPRVECEVIYGEFSACSASCGGGYRYQKGFIKTSSNGLNCPAPSLLTKREACNSYPCPVKVDCEVIRSYWGECSAACGGGQQSRTIQIVQQAQNGGYPCPTNNIETRSCNNEPCRGVAPPQPYSRGGVAGLAGNNANVNLGRKPIFITPGGGVVVVKGPGFLGSAAPSG